MDERKLSNGIKSQSGKRGWKKVLIWAVFTSKPNIKEEIPALLVLDDTSRKHVDYASAKKDFSTWN